MGVEFEENQYNPRFNVQDSVPKIAGFLIKKGIVKDVASANKLQVVVAVIFFVLAIYLMF